MVARTFACLRFRGRRVLRTLFLGASLAMAISATAQGQTSFARECAMKDISVLTLIENHGEAQVLPGDRIYNAMLMQLRARSACYEGRISEALALYDSILDLGPVASAQR